MPRSKLVLGFALLLSGALGACNCGSRGVRKAIPSLTVTPDHILFKQAAPGVLQTQMVTVSNTGSADLDLAEPTIAENDGDSQEEIGIQAGSLATDCTNKARANRLKLSPGECAALVVRYVPKNLDDDVGTLSFISNSDNTQTDVPIGLAPMHLALCALNADGSTGACADPRDPTRTIVDFGVGSVGVASAPRDLVVKNISDSDVTGLLVKRTGSADYKLDGTGLPAQLAPGATANLHVTFTASVGGTRVGAIVVSSKEDPDLAAKVTGTGDAPGLCADPMVVDFGAVAIGSTKDQVVTLTSCGTKPIQLSSVAVVPGAPFSAPSGLPGAQSMAPQAKLSVTVRYGPTVVQSDIGALQIVSENGTANVSLTGRAIEPPSCKLTPSATTLDFGQVALGYSGDRPLNIVNRGTLPCDLTNMAVTSGSPTFLPKAFPANYPLTVPPGAVVTYQFTYSPPAGDTNANDTGVVTFTSTDPHYAAQSGNFTVALTGQPTATPRCKLQIDPGSSGSGGPFGGFGGAGGRMLMFGQVLVGDSKVLPATFTNTGSADCNITDVKFTSIGSIPGFPGGSCSGLSCDPYSLTNVPPTTFRISPGAQQIINVQYAPTSVPSSQTGGGQGNYLQVNTTDTIDYDGGECQSFFGGSGGGPGCVQFMLIGEASKSDLHVLPSSLDFGIITLGCNSPQKTVTLANAGSAAIEIDDFSLNPTQNQNTGPYYIVSHPPLTASGCQSGVSQCYILGGGKQATVTLKYHPTTIGAESAQLVIKAHASNTTSTNPYITVPLTGSGTADTSQTDTFVQGNQQVDVLWVIDMDNLSMADKQQAVHDNAQKFIQAAQAASTDYHLGVVSSYVDGNEKTNCDHVGGFTGTPGCTAKSSYNNVTIVPGGLYHDVGAPAWVSPTDANPVQTFANNALIGLTHDAAGTESGLDAMVRALDTSRADYPADNKGFVRKDGRLVVISISDDEDNSSQDTSFYGAFLQALKPGHPQDAIFDTVGGDYAPVDSPNGGGCTNGVDGDNPIRYHDVTAATGGKMYSICNGDYSGIAADLSLGAFAGRTHFPLSRPCDPATLVVKVNGVTRGPGTSYTFDANLDAIDFKTAPAQGVTITATYSAQCF